MLLRLCSLMFLYLLSMLMSTGAYAENKAHIAVASNFSPVMKALQTLFEMDTGHQLTVSYGSSGKLYTQIIHGAPYHAFLSADQEKPDILIKQNKAIAHSRFTYAQGRLGFWAPKKTLTIDNINALNFQRIAIANPKVAPYGLAAMAVLNKLGTQTEGKLVLGENIAQAFQFVDSGNASAGLVAISQLIQQHIIDSGEVVVIPASFHAPINQDAVLISHNNQNHVASVFLAFLRSDNAISIIKKYGYDVRHETNFHKGAPQ